MDPTVWEAIFFLLALKIPLVFVGIVVWRAIKAVPEPEPDEPTAAVPVTDTPPDAPPWTSRRGGPGGGPRHDRRRTGTRRQNARATTTR